MITLIFFLPFFPKSFRVWSLWIGTCITRMALKLSLLESAIFILCALVVRTKMIDFVSFYFEYSILQNLQGALYLTYSRAPTVSCFQKQLKYPKQYYTVTKKVITSTIIPMMIDAPPTDNALNSNRLSVSEACWLTWYREMRNY